jgi:hypothetical protein
MAMGTVFSPRCIAVVFATLITVGIPFSSAAAQGLESCLRAGASYPADYYLPQMSGWVVMSDERRNAEQLAATFPDPADALSRLHAYCWLGQAERVYANAQDDLTVDVSIVDDFLETEGPTLAQRWFAYQRANDLGLERDIRTRGGLEEELGEAGLRPVNIEALNNIAIDAYHNDTEHTLYARRGTGTSTQTGSHLPPNRVVRVSVSGEPSVSGRSRESVAYQVLAEVFGVDLFPGRS